MMRTGWDIDGVGFNFGDSCYRYLCHIGQEDLWKSGPNPEPYWDWYKDWGWTGQQFVDFCNAGADAGFIFAGPVREGYREAIDEVANMGHEIIVATDRPFGSTPEVSQNLTVDWFSENKIWYDELHFTAHKPSANCDVFIDDKIENYDSLVQAGCKAYLLNRPWNKVEGGDARNRIDTLEEYVDAIKVLTEEGAAQLSFV
jgi:hypothetical protein